MADRAAWQRTAINTEEMVGKELYPFPLTIMERFLVWDHSVQFPKRFQIVVSCDGDLNDEIWTQALKDTIVRHPMLLARVEGYDRKWVMPAESGFELAFMDWTNRNAEEVGADAIAQAIVPDDECDSSLRTVVVRQADGICLAFDVYHPACDGLGMRLFIEDATTCYNALAQGDESLRRWKTLDSERLLHRGELPAPKVKDGTRRTSIWEKMVHAYHFHFKRPAPIRSRKGGPENGTGPALRFCAAELDFDQLGEMREFFLDSSINVNEWASYCLLETFRQWQTERGEKAKRARIAIPVDLRVWDDLRLSAANKIGFAFVVANEKRADSTSALLKNIKDQFEMIRELCLGSDFVKLFQPFQNHGGFVRAIMKRTHCFATAVLTNLGDVTARQRKGRNSGGGRSSAGDLRLKSIHGWPPIRPGTQLGVGLCRYDQRLSVAAVFDTTSFSAAEIDELFAKFIAMFSARPQELG